jgi:hypothetical protein
MKNIKKIKQPKLYKIADVAIQIDENGKAMFWCNNIGYHAEQGGMCFGWGNFGTDTLDSTLNVLKDKLEKAMPEIMVKIDGEKNGNT